MDINQINLLLPEIALSIMILALFGTTLARPRWISLQSLALILSAICVAAALFSFGQTGLLFFGTYKVDGLSQLFKIIITLGLFLVIGTTPGVRGIEEKLRAEYLMFLAIGTLGLICLASSYELLTLLMSLEISAFALNVIIPVPLLWGRASPHGGGHQVFPVRDGQHRCHALRDELYLRPGENDLSP